MTHWVCNSVMITYGLWGMATECIMIRFTSCCNCIIFTFFFTQFNVQETHLKEKFTHGTAYNNHFHMTTHESDHKPLFTFCYVWNEPKWWFGVFALCEERNILNWHLNWRPLSIEVSFWDFKQICLSTGIDRPTPHSRLLIAVAYVHLPTCVALLKTWTLWNDWYRK